MNKTTRIHAEEESEAWQYQLRLQLAEEAARHARNSRVDPALQSLYDILASHNAKLVCQFDAFAGFCEQLERRGEQELPLYKWTKDTIEDPVKKEKYIKIFTIYVHGEEVYSRKEAEDLEKELQSLVGGGAIEKMSKYDSNPVNNPQVPKKYQS